MQRGSGIGARFRTVLTFKDTEWREEGEGRREKKEREASGEWRIDLGAGVSERRRGRNRYDDRDTESGSEWRG